MKSVFYFLVFCLLSTTNVAQNDIAIHNAFYTSHLDSNLTNYYSGIPKSQAILDSVYLSATVSNYDTNIQTNVRIRTIIMAPLSTDTMYSAPIQLNAYQTDSLALTSPITFFDGTGAYSWITSVISDSVDGNAINNSLDTFTTWVTDTTYSRDFNASQSVFLQDGIITEIATSFKTLDTVRTTSVSIGIGSQSYPDETISIFIYDSILADSQEITKREFVLIPSIINTDTVVTYRIPSVVLPPGKYFISQVCYSKDGPEIIQFPNASPNSVFIDSLRDGNWSSTEINPFIRLNISNHLHCDLHVDLDYQPPNTGIAHVSGGNPPYSYHWDNGDTTATSHNFHPYYPFFDFIKVEDDSSCIARADTLLFNSVSELNFKGKCTILPNANNGRFQVQMTNMENGDYTISITDISGKIILVETLQIKGDWNKTYHLKQLENGMYFLVVTNKQGQKSTQRFVVQTDL